MLQLNNSIKGHGDAFAIDELNKYCIGQVNKLKIHEYLTKNFPIVEKIKKWTKFLSIFKNFCRLLEKKSEKIHFRA